MGTNERREREKAETRRRIMEATRDLLVKLGYEGVSMRKVAEEIEYSPAAIYVHFKDKDQLIRDVCEQDFEALAQTFTQMQWSTDSIERVRQLGRAYVKFGIEHPKHYQLMFMTELPVRPDEKCMKHKGDPAHDGYAALTSAVNEAVKDPRWQGETDVNLISQTLWAAVHGLTSMVVTMANDPWIQWHDIDDRTELLIRSIIDGMMRIKLAPKPRKSSPSSSRAKGGRS